MKNKLFIPVLLISFLALALVLSGCSNGSTGDDRPAWVQALDDGYQHGEFNSFAGSSNGDHVLLWGSFNASYSEIVNTISTQGWTFTSYDSGKSAAIIVDAVAVLQYCLGGIDYLDGGIEFDTYSNLVDFQKDGIGSSTKAPALNTAMHQNSTVPVAAVFDSGEGFFVVCFVDSK